MKPYMYLSVPAAFESIKHKTDSNMYTLTDMRAYVFPRIQNYLLRGHSPEQICNSLNYIYNTEAYTWTYNKEEKRVSIYYHGQFVCVLPDEYHF